jgi:hypothetical protein
VHSLGIANLVLGAVYWVTMTWVNDLGDMHKCPHAC